MNQDKQEGRPQWTFVRILLETSVGATSVPDLRTSSYFPLSYSLMLVCPGRTDSVFVLRLRLSPCCVSECNLQLILLLYLAVIMKGNSECKEDSMFGKQFKQVAEQSNEKWTVKAKRQKT